jgi:protein-S-isoprenylcysteine O-methyltransferase Ste14
MSAERDHLATDNPSAANLGVIRPPLVYLFAILAAVVLNLIRPARFLPDGLRMLIGIPIVVAAIVLFRSSVRRFNAAGTPVPGNKPTTTIVRSGPYRWTRNPIYIAFSMLQLGIACLLNNPWALASLVVAWGVMASVVIPKEERYLERRFGAEYLEYKAKVRRWI